MPAGLATIDAHFPRFKGNEDVGEQIGQIMNYLQVLSEQLRYMMNNLDSSNFNTEALKKLKIETTEDLVKQVEEMNETLSGVSNSLNALSGTVLNVKGKVETMEGTITETITPGLTTLQEAVQVDGDGNITIGADDKAVEITGTVTVNGVPI